MLPMNGFLTRRDILMNKPQLAGAVFFLLLGNNNKKKRARAQEANGVTFPRKLFLVIFVPFFFSMEETLVFTPLFLVTIAATSRRAIHDWPTCLFID